MLCYMEFFCVKKLKNFFSKRSFKSNPLKRTKSVTKLERKRCTIDGDSVPPSRLRTSRSHESLLQSSPSALATLDLSHGDVHVAPLHSSLLGQDHCFQMISSGGTRFYTCRTKEERDRWLYSLRRTIHPDQDSVCRKENSLRIWILEAKGMAAKKSKYFCELCLDKTLYARTSSKQKVDMCFWGEHFEFNSNLPCVDTVSVNLYREADKKKRRDKNVLIGCVNIPVSSINGRHLLEKWYPVTTEKGVGGKDNPSIRIKSRFQTIEILPLVVYKDLLQFVKMEYKIICEMLEPVISVRAKEDVATTLVNIMQKESMAKEFLAEVVMSDIEKIGDLHLTFRGNSLATKATEAYMKLLGDKYLQDTLGMFLKMALDSSDDCEVDHLIRSHQWYVLTISKHMICTPSHFLNIAFILNNGNFHHTSFRRSLQFLVDPMKVTNNASLQRQQSHLMTYVEMVWVKIINSANHFPSELQEVFHEFRKRISSIGKEELCDNLISASIFLRFLCPAILSPSLFNLTQEYPQGKSARNLTLVAKTIQTLANFTKFGGKESFMEFMNGFVEKEWSTMKAFLRKISSPTSKEFQRRTDFDGCIDMGKELAVLHNLLVESIPRVNQKCYFDYVDTLQHVLDGISCALAQKSDISQEMHITISGSQNNLSSASSDTTNNNTSMKGSVPPKTDQECSDLHNLQKEAVQSYSIKNTLVKDIENEYYSLSAVSEKTVVPVTPLNRPSTLPRNAYLLGSAKKAATDLSTSDDYVLFSAFDTDHSLMSGKGTGVNINDVSSPFTRESSLSPRLTQSCIYGEVLNNDKPAPGCLGMNISVYNDHPHKVLNAQRTASESNFSSKNGIVLRNVLVSNPKTAVQNSDKYETSKTAGFSDQKADEDQNNSSGETGTCNNTKGNQISISQLSAVASSGYQSFPFSQSNSPIDPAYQHEGSRAPALIPPPHLPPPLAFNNPMYHFPTAVTALPWERGDKKQRKLLRVSYLNSFSSHSAEDISILGRSSLGSADSTPVLSVEGCCCCSSSSSSGTASCSSTPPRERKSSQFKSTAPRTNPHYSGLQHANTKDAGSCSPHLNVKVSANPSKSRHHRSHVRSRPCRSTASFLHRKPKNLNHITTLHDHQNGNMKIVSPADHDNCSGNRNLHSDKVVGGNSKTTSSGKAINKNNNAKSAEDYEHEVEQLRQLMLDLQSKLSEAENKLSKQETVTEKVVADWQARLEAGEERIRRQQEEKDQQMKNIITRLITVEEELRREQQEMQGVIVAKQKVIDAQERKIQTLDATNTRLLGALSQLKERYQLQGCNGSTPHSPTSPSKIPVLENGDGRFKSSSC